MHVFNWTICKLLITINIRAIFVIFHQIVLTTRGCVRVGHRWYVPHVESWGLLSWLHNNTPVRHRPSSYNNLNIITLRGLSYPHTRCKREPITRQYLIIPKSFVKHQHQFVSELNQMTETLATLQAKKINTTHTPDDLFAFLTIHSRRCPRAMSIVFAKCGCVLKCWWLTMSPLLWAAILIQCLPCAYYFWWVYSSVRWSLPGYSQNRLIRSAHTGAPSGVNEAHYYIDITISISQ